MNRLPGRTRQALVASTALLTIAAGVVPASAQQLVPPGADAVVQYTEYGIPHITANSFTDLGKGYGYASAKDNLCVLADTYLTLDAQRSRFLGPDAPPNTALGAAHDSLTSDLYFQNVNDSGVVERFVARPAPQGPRAEVRELVRGYAAGYNRYLQTVGVNDIGDPACRGARWVRPINELDVYRHLYAVATISGTATMMNGIVNAAPPPAADDRAAAASAPTRADELIHALRARQGGTNLGSNAIAAGSDGTSSGRSVLLGNPHYPWQGARRFWQAQLTVPGKLDVAGAGLLGVPFVMIGHNRDVAWSHTVSTAATFGLYETPVVPGSPTEYLVDGRRETMTSREVAVDVRRPDGAIEQVRRTFWSTRYGPVLGSGPGNVPLPWAETVFSVRDANATNLRMLNSWFGLGGARDTDELAGVLDRTQGIPWVNTVATDRRGRALFSDVQVVPHVTDELASRCSTPLGSQTFPRSGISVLDGGRSECAWGADADAVEPGLFGPARLPRLDRGDFVSNFNDSAWLTNPEQPLVGYPRGTGDAGTPRSPRTQQGIVSAQRRLAGTDGLPGRGFTLEAMQRILFADRSRIAELAVGATRTMCESFAGGRAPSSNGDVDVAAGCAALATWPGAYTLDSRGSLLFAGFAAKLASVPGGPWQRPFDPADPVNTPNTLAIARPEVQRAFGDAAAELHAAGIPLDAPLGEHQAVTRNGEPIPIHGAPGRLGVLNVITPVTDPRGRIAEVADGSSFIQVVEFDGGDHPRTETLLTYSQSSDPTSPHFADQTRLFSAGRWVRERFTQEEIRNSPELRTEVLRE